MPLVRIHWVVIDPVRRAEADPAVGAAREHHVSSVATGLHAGQHVNVVVGRATRPVHCQEQLPCKSSWIYRPTKNEATAKVHLSDLVKRRCHVRVLRIAGTNAPERAGEVACAADKKVAVGGHVERAPHRRIRNTEWTLPGESTICGSAKLPKAARRSGTPSVVLESVPHAVGLVDREPFLVSSSRASLGWQTCPGLTAISRAPDIITKRFEQTKIEKPSCFIR